MKFKKGVISTISILVFSATLFATDLSPLKKAVSENNTSIINSLLEEASSEDLPQYEAYILEQAKTLIMKGNYEAASSLTETVLMFDFDNKEAQNLYTSIEKAKKDKIKEAEEKKAHEAAKKAEADQKKKEQAEADEAAYIKSLEGLSLANFPLSVSLTPLAFNIATSSYAENSPNFRYGLGFGIKTGYLTPEFKINLRTDYDFYPTALAGTGTYSNLNLRTTFSSSKWKLPLCGGIGYKRFTTSDATSLYTALGGAYITAGIDDIIVRELIELSGFFDWNLCSFTADSLIDFSCGAEIRLRYKHLIPNTKYKFYVENSDAFDVFIIDGKSEFYLNPKFSVGVILNGR